MIITQRLDISSIPLDAAAVGRFLKIKPRSPRFAEMLQVIERVDRTHRHIFAPAFQYRICRFRICSGAAHEYEFGEQGVRLASPALTRRLRRAAHAALFAVTAGSGYESVRQTYQRTDVLLAFVFDGIASAVAQMALQVLRETLQVEARKRGCTLTPHISPGYPKFALAQQQPLFALLQPEAIGVELTPAFYMIPQKSISGVLALVPQTRDDT